MQKDSAPSGRAYGRALQLMAFICKDVCSKDKNIMKQRYSNGLVVYCSVCEKMFLKENNPGNYCKCCGCRTRNNPRTKSSSRIRKYTY